MEEEKVRFSEAQVTPRGFSFIEFCDGNNKFCSLQESSADGAFIWLGSGGERMHLSREHVAKLLPYLQAFAETGDAFSCENK